MEFNFKNHQISKIKKYIKLNNFILLTYGANKNSSNWVVTEQGLHKINLTYYKVYNNVVVKEIKKTTLRKFSKLITSTIFLLEPRKSIDKSTVLTNTGTLIKSLQSIRFDTYALKLNNKIYSISQLKSTTSLKYDITIKILYQFLITHIKNFLTINIRNQNFETM